jgi:hypothetical protein
VPVRALPAEPGSLVDRSHEGRQLSSEPANRVGTQPVDRRVGDHRRRHLQAGTVHMPARRTGQVQAGGPDPAQRLFAYHGGVLDLGALCGEHPHQGRQPVQRLSPAWRAVGVHQLRIGQLFEQVLGDGRFGVQQRPGDPGGELGAVQQGEPS